MLPYTLTSNLSSSRCISVSVVFSAILCHCSLLLCAWLYCCHWVLFVSLCSYLSSLLFSWCCSCLFVLVHINGVLHCSIVLSLSLLSVFFVRWVVLLLFACIVVSGISVSGLSCLIMLFWFSSWSPKYLYFDPC